MCVADICVCVNRMGKTIQIVAFLSGMFETNRIKTVLIVLPVALILNWTREFEKWWVRVHHHSILTFNVT